jgi:FKBP-type peptidyl-prolyl cis-trans isomerase FkpA
VIVSRIIAYVVVLAVAVFSAACNDDYNSNPNDPSQVKIEFTVTDLVVGNGNPAAVGNVATVNYAGWLYNSGGPESKGRQFADSVAANTPAVVTIGRLQYIPGFEQALLGMRVGGKRRAYIPSDLGYGPGGAGDGAIPPNAALVYEIDMVGLVQP